jgi:hypothetical protein
MMMKRTLNLQANLIAEREKFECGLDKLSQTWYNILMRKTNNMMKNKNTKKPVTKPVIKPVIKPEPMQWKHYD